jgi:glutaminyl-peptide cyclotransferase
MFVLRKVLIAAFLISALESLAAIAPYSFPVCVASPLEAVTGRAATPVYDYRVVNEYPHDPDAFTQGLFFDGVDLYESTGLHGRSSVCRIDLLTGKVQQINPLPVFFFGEGITGWQDVIIQLTWQSQVAFVYDKKTLQLVRTLPYTGEGWGITQVGGLLITSDGSEYLCFRDPASFAEVRRLRVHDQGVPVRLLNELENVEGEIFANVWRTDRIARISPDTGEVLGWLDLGGLKDALHSKRPVDVLNGIAYDAGRHRLFVTGKLWPKLFQIEIVDRK